jgi:hypothetical protein
MAKIVPMPICEVCDKLTIARLKYERLPDHEMDKTLLLRQIEHYTEGVDESDTILHDLIAKLYEANGRIWDAESELRSGYENSLGNAEIAKRAVRIRDENRRRVAIKNEISGYASQHEFVDCKSNHLSA